MTTMMIMMVMAAKTELLDIPDGRKEQVHTESCTNKQSIRVIRSFFRASLLWCLKLAFVHTPLSVCVCVSRLLKQHAFWNDVCDCDCNCVMKTMLAEFEVRVNGRGWWGYMVERERECEGGRGGIVV